MKKRKALMTLVFVGAASLPFLVSAAGTNTKIRPHKVAIESALDSNNYEAFKNLINKDSSSVITEEIFQKLVTARSLQKAGDKVGAEKIMTELGLKKSKVNHLKGFFQNLTDAQKEVLKHAKELTDAGKAEEAKILLTNAGIKIPEHRGPFLGEPDGKFANLTDAQKTAMKEARALIKQGKKDEAKQKLQTMGM
jgi:hypothetical protein